MCVAGFIGVFGGFVGVCGRFVGVCGGCVGVCGGFVGVSGGFVGVCGGFQGNWWQKRKTVSPRWRPGNCFSDPWTSVPPHWVSQLVYRSVSQ